jgi:hypothetical protein
VGSATYLAGHVLQQQGDEPEPSSRQPAFRSRHLKRNNAD